MPARNRFVIDASVAVKWLHEENKTNTALKILENINRGTATAIVPDLIMYEVANALIRGIGKPIIEAQEALDFLADISWQVIPPTPELVKDAMQFASDHQGLSLYDSIYASVALYYDAVVITDDKQFNKIAGKPLTRLL